MLSGDESLSQWEAAWCSGHGLGSGESIGFET